MRKFAVFLLVICVAIVIASLYGIGHDQVTYGISPEYYTRYKFIQFNLADSGAARHMTQPRSAVVMTGVKSTWMIGLAAGVALGLFALAFRNADRMFQSAMQAIGLALLITIACAVIGGLYGHNVLAHKGVSWWMPDNISDKPDYITVGTTTNFSYAGAMIGAVAGIIFLLIKNSRLRRQAEEE
ncbi:MAG: hypothetical protein JST42_11955 [Bacteroidetes bacterium]|nr:hypothetical protein [Bacteroidota bacterium]